ncbi:MAG: hypothetical protein HGA78_10920, partial [Nitrospirales bacterium]|nr:hypothetical protein [Nitrospirales bacterium]
MIRINLLEEKERKGKRPLSLLVIVGGIAALTLLLTGAVYFYLGSRVSAMQKTSETNKAMLVDLAKKADEIKRFEKLNKEIGQSNK